MSENERVSGKRRHQRDQLKEREAAMAKAGATPSTPPQDPAPVQPAAAPEAPTDTPRAESTPEPGRPADTAPREDDPKPSLEVDYKQQYRSLSEEHRKLTAAHNTLKGKYNKAEQELRSLREQPNSKPSGDVIDSVRETEAFQRITKNWSEEDAEDFASLAAHFAQGSAPSEPEPAPTPASAPEDPFFVSLDNQLPGWDVKYNDNKSFITWANANFEPFSGESYQALLEKAQSESDVSAAMRIFSAFDRSRVSQTTSTTPEDYIEPSGSGGAGTTQPEAPRFESGYLEEQMKLLQRNKITRDEFYKRRNEFMKANQEGRVKTAA